ncbi:MAG: hypothetical protein AB7F28_05750 [Candidatus Margulisiibacteriota bacterium]
MPLHRFVALACTFTDSPTHFRQQETQQLNALIAKLSSNLRDGTSFSALLKNFEVPTNPLSIHYKFFVLLQALAKLEQDPSNREHRREAKLALIRLFPKAELHTHFDGACRMDDVLAEYKRQAIEPDEKYLAKYSTFAAKTHEHELHDTVVKTFDEVFPAFLGWFEFNLKVMQTREGIITLAKGFIKQAREEGIDHLEVRFAPCLHQIQGLGYDEIMDAMTEGLLQGREAYGVEVSLIAGIYRNKLDEYPNHENDTVDAVLNAAQRHAGKPVHFALDVVGYEPPNPLSDRRINEALQRYVTERSTRDLQANTALTLHVGEGPGCEQNIDLALDFAEAMGNQQIRFGHANHATSVQLAAIEQRQIPIESCPNSNVLLCCEPTQPTLADQPFYAWVLQNPSLKVSLSTDDSAALGEQELSEIILELSEDSRLPVVKEGQLNPDWARVLTAGVAGGFLSDSNKAKLLADQAQRMAALDPLIALIAGRLSLEPIPQPTATVA